MKIQYVIVCVLLSCVKGQDILSIKPEVFIEGEPGNVTCTYNNQRIFEIYGNISDKQAITTCNIQAITPCTNNVNASDFDKYYSLSNTSNSLTVHINTVNRTRDGGQWRCISIGSNGEIKDSITIDVKVPVSSAEITNKNEDLIKDRTVNLECKTTGGYPLPNITWSIDTRILMTSVSTTTSRLPYQPVVSDQGQRLQCSATNGYGQSQTDSFQLDIIYKPVVDIKPSITPYKLIQNQTVELECQVKQSNPVVTSYKWYRNGNTISGSSLYTVSNDGSYSCSATNSLGESDRSRVISVEILYPPTVSTLPSPYSIIESTTLIIPCIATSNPVPNNYTWSGPNNLIQSQQNLTLSSINRDQTGQYTCRVSNLMIPTTGRQQTGIGFTSTTLNVLSSPDSPQGVRLKNKTYVICIEWTPGFNGGASQSFIVQHSTDDKTWVNSSPIPDGTNNGGVDYCIEGLEPDTSYYIRVIASNKYGESFIGIYTDKQETQTTQTSTTVDSYNGENGCDDRFGAGVGTGLGIALAIHVVIVLGILLYRYQQGKRKKQDKTYDSVASRGTADGQTYQELNTVRSVETPQASVGVDYYNLGADQTRTDYGDKQPYVNL